MRVEMGAHVCTNESVAYKGARHAQCFIDSRPRRHWVGLHFASGDRERFNALRLSLSME